MIDDNVRHLPRIGIGDAMRLHGMTARAIRFYEEKGLIQPRRDRTNVRFYDGPARWRLAWIAQLRKAGVSLPDIKAVLQAQELAGQGRERALSLLETRRESLLAALQQVEATMAEIALSSSPSAKAG
jgi:DNA-binding transcriptional MerR regulator